MIRISNIQLFVLIMAFEVGSTTLFALGIGAGRDAWIVVLLAALIGLCLLWVYTAFPKQYPNKDFSEILNELLGKKLAKPLLLLFGFQFLSAASHNFYEFGALIKITALPLTPSLVILYFYIIVIIYILCLGFEVLARTCEVLLPYLVMFLMIIFIFISLSGQFDLSTLQPVLGAGIQNVIGVELIEVIAFPFGEMIIFLMFFHYIGDQKLIRRTAFLAVGLSALLLFASLIMMISTLGPELTANAEIPLLEMVLSINIADIITNLDSIAVFILFIGGFYKTALHFLGFALAITWFFNKKNPKWILIIGGLLFPLYVVNRFQGLHDQRWKGFEVNIPTIFLYAFLPVLLFIIMSIKKRKKSPS
ncbi:GerAB/ArcD/ProY family transporter [Halalkalibacter kiskunsagensis]|uniref:GerAB/ArcD/ProY family transporter n=1 Tax=Halalkalibacter kiskunsagensis TaxID=1548599 RepID=A0ABV6KDG3_9BACI